jgi:hypothetical protein
MAVLTILRQSACWLLPILCVCFWELVWGLSIGSVLSSQSLFFVGWECTSVHSSGISPSCTLESGFLSFLLCLLSPSKLSTHKDPFFLPRKQGVWVSHFATAVHLPRSDLPFNLVITFQKQK